MFLLDNSKNRTKIEYYFKHSIAKMPIKGHFLVFSTAKSYSNMQKAVDLYFSFWYNGQ